MTTTRKGTFIGGRMLSSVPTPRRDTRYPPSGWGTHETLPAEADMLLATQLAPEIPMKRTSHDPAPARFTWTALPVQLNLRPNACRLRRVRVGQVFDAVPRHTGDDCQRTYGTVRAPGLRGRLLTERERGPGEGEEKCDSGDYESRGGEESARWHGASFRATGTIARARDGKTPIPCKRLQEAVE